jgi:hypothetical protein
LLFAALSVAVSESSAGRLTAQKNTGDAMIAGMFNMSRLDRLNHPGTLQASDFRFSHQDIAHFLFLSPYCLPWPQSGPQLPRKNCP